MSTYAYDSFNSDDSGAEDSIVSAHGKDSKAFRQKAHAYKHVDLGNASTDENTKYIQRVGKRFKCLICEKTYGRHNSVRHHITVYHRNRPHVCGVCSFSTREARYIHLHRFKLHGIALPNYMHHTMPQCDKCGQLCKNGPALSRHTKRCKHTENSMVDVERPLDLATKPKKLLIDVEEVFEDEMKPLTDEASAVDAFFGAENISRLPITPPDSSEELSSDTSAVTSPAVFEPPVATLPTMDVDDLFHAPNNATLPGDLMEAVDRYLHANIEGDTSSSDGGDELELLSRLLE